MHSCTLKGRGVAPMAVSLLIMACKVVLPVPTGSLLKMEYKDTSRWEALGAFVMARGSLNTGVQAKFIQLLDGAVDARGPARFPLIWPVVWWHSIKCRASSVAPAEPEPACRST